MIAGRFAFQGLSEYLTWQKIKQLDYTFPEGFDPEAADLVRRLLVRPDLCGPTIVYILLIPRDAGAGSA
jgi:hypothetical protein